MRGTLKLVLAYVLLFMGTSANAVDVVRFIAPNEHFYTTNSVEMDYVRDMGWYSEGRVFEVSTTQVPGTIPMHRVNLNGYHVFTNSLGLVNLMKSWGGIQEGYLGYIYSDQQPGTVPLYSYADGSTQSRFLTINPNEPPPPGFVADPFGLIAGYVYPPPPATDKWVTGYYAGWHWNKFDYQAPDYVDMSTMTHFVFARVVPGTGTAAGTVVQEEGYDWYDPTKGPGKKDTPARTVEQYLIDKAHAVGTKALIMLGGEGANAGFEASTANATVRAQFVQNLVNYMVARGYDGIDVNWESIPLSDNTNWTRLEDLLRDLRIAANNTSEFTAKGGIIITFPASFLNTNYENATSDHVTVAGLVDQFNVMSYGMAWYGTGWDSTHFAPIDGHTATQPIDIKSTVQMYVDAGIPRSKIGMGIGLYGMSYKPPITHPGQATACYTDVLSTYDEDWNWAMLNKLGYLNNGTYVWDSTAKMGYRTYETSGYTPAGRTTTTSGYVSYEDPSSIAAKGTWAHSTAAGEGVAGTIVWLVNFGTTNRLNNPMMVEVKKAFIDPNATAAPIPSQQLTASYTITSDWGTGYCAGLTVANAGPVTAYDWTVSLQVVGTLSATWGEATITQSGNTLTMVSVSENDANDIVPNDTYTGAGFCVNR